MNEIMKEEFKDSRKVVWTIIFLILILGIKININMSNSHLLVYYDCLPNCTPRLFYDTGNGYNEAEKIISYVDKKEKKIEFIFPSNINISEIEKIRVDLAYDENSVQITKLEWRNNGIIINKINPIKLENYLLNDDIINIEKNNKAYRINSRENNVNISLSKEFILLANRNIFQVVIGYILTIIFPILGIVIIEILLRKMKKYVLKKTYRVNLILAIMGVLFCTLFCNDRITSCVLNCIFPEVQMDKNTMYDNGYVKYQAYNRNLNNILVSNDRNAMLLIYLPCINSQRVITLDMEIECYDEKNSSAKLYYVPQYDYMNIQLVEGINSFYLDQIRKDTSLLRLDLVSKINSKIEINRIIINNNLKMTDFVVRYARIVLLIYCILIIVLNILWKILQYRKIEIKVKNNIIFECIICIALFLFLTINIESKLCGRELLTIIKMKGIDVVDYLNCIYVVVLWGLFINLFGKKIGQILYYIIYIVFSIMQYVKLKYHDEMFTKQDISLIGDAILILNKYISTPVIIIAMIVILSVIILGILFIIKKNKENKICIQRKAVELLILFVVINFFFLNNGLKVAGIDINRKYNNQIERYQGLGLYGFCIVDLFSSESLGKPENYSEEIVQEVKKIKRIENRIIDEKPTIIVILAESLFEIQNDNNIEFPSEILPNITKYKIGNAMSCSYGGKTSYAEYEVLTGLSNYYLNCMAYQTDISKGKNPSGSLAREFSENGYKSVAIHANSANFYNRENVYKNLGFIDYISKEDMQIEKNEVCSDGYVKDSVLVDEIIKCVEEDNVPKFIFGISIESHGPYMNKFEDSKIECSSGVYNKEEMREVRNYLNAISDFDTEMERMIEYFDKNDKPVEIYIFGDHMPLLEINEKSGYLNDVYKKYCTPVYGYSNCMEIRTFEDPYVSLNQLTIEVLKNSGISYRSYFDVLSLIREKYPVLHEELDGYDDTDEILDLYKRINWDMIFGKRYLLK